MPPEGRLLEAPEERLPPDEEDPPEERPAEELGDRLPPEERELPAVEDRGATVRPEPLDLELGARTLDEGDRELGDAEPTLEVEVRGTIMGDEPPTLEPEVRGVTSVRPPMVLPLRDDAELLPLPAE